jgi:hypothetical protein
MDAGDMTIRSPGRLCALGPGRLRARASATAIACAGLALFADGGCGDSTLDLFNTDLGLLAHWAFDESQAGSTAADSSGFGLHATPSANPPTPTRDVPPVQFSDPYSLSFNGQDQWIDIGNPPLLNAGGQVSIAAWVRPANIDGYHNIVAHGWRMDPNHDVALRINSGSYEFTYWSFPDHQAVSAIPTSDVGTWVHLCGVFDGSAYHVYRNGALAASTADSTAPPPNVDTPWAIGARAPQPDGLERLMQGEIDDVRIYGRALSAPEVEALYRR